VLGAESAEFVVYKGQTLNIFFIQLNYTSFNVTMLSKQSWRFQTDPSILFLACLRHNIFLTSILLDLELGIIGVYLVQKLW